MAKCWVCGQAAGTYQRCCERPECRAAMPASCRHRPRPPRTVQPQLALAPKIACFRPYAVVHNVTNRWGDEFPVCDGQYATEARARDAARRLAEAHGYARVERWSSKHGDRGREEVIEEFTRTEDESWLTSGTTTDNSSTPTCCTGSPCPTTARSA